MVAKNTPTDMLVVILKEQVRPHGPHRACQRPNVHPSRGCAVRRTRDPATKVARQRSGQAIPVGELVTRPLPWTATFSARRMDTVVGAAFVAPAKTSTKHTAKAIAKRERLGTRRVCHGHGLRTLGHVPRRRATGP